jgi:hypothetical protein
LKEIFASSSDKTRTPEDGKVLMSAKGLFLCQIAVVSRQLPTLEHLLEDAHEAQRRKLDTLGPEKK